MQIYITHIYLYLCRYICIIYLMYVYTTWLIASSYPPGRWGRLLSLRGLYCGEHWLREKAVWGILFFSYWGKGQGHLKFNGVWPSQRKSTCILYYSLLSLKCKISAIWLVETACIFLIFLIATVHISMECETQES